MTSATPNLRDGISGINLVPITGGYHVMDTEDGLHCIDVLTMLFGWRLVLSDKRGVVGEHCVIDAAWCYFGSGTDEHGFVRNMEQAFLNCVLAAVAWDGVGEPQGYNKVAGT